LDFSNGKAMNARIGLARAQLLRRVARSERSALWRDPLHVKLPTYTETRIESAELTDVQPAEYRADLVVLLCDTRPVLGIIVSGFGRSCERVLNTPVTGSRVVAWAHREHVALRAVEPRQHPNLLANGQVAQCVGYLRRKDEPSVRPPSNPCFGARSRSTSGDSTRPIGRSS
jgi:hypothetical protein